MNLYQNELEKTKSRITKINQDITTIFKRKNTIIWYLEEKKKDLRNLKYGFNLNEKSKFTVYTAARIISILDRGISLIQSTHDMLVNDLNVLTKNLEGNLDIIEQTDFIMNILNYKMYEIRYHFRAKMDELEQKKDRIKATSLTDQSETEICFQLVELDKAIVECQEAHNKEIESIKLQKIDAQQEFENVIATMDRNFDKMCNRYDNLIALIETEKANVSESQTELIDAKVFMEADNFKKTIENFRDLQKTGWKITYSDEDIAAILEERGLRLTKSGILITTSGECITYEEAKRAKLLEDVKINWNNLLNKEEKDKKDDALSKDSENTECLRSASSKMLSEDVAYLKENLGKPLTMALAEITTVQPRDPIHYLGHWLFKYRYNQEKSDIDKIEFDALNAERNRIAEERWHQFIEQEARAAVIEMITRAEEQALLNELRRIEKELQEMEEENQENLDDEARDVMGEYKGPVTGQN